MSRYQESALRARSLLLTGVLAGSQFATADTLSIIVGDNSTIRSTVGNQGTSQILFAGDTTTSGDYMRSAVAFDLSNPLLSGATINSATLTFTVREPDSGTTGSANATITLNLHQLSSSFTTTGVTWTSRDGTNNWTTAGGDFDSAVLASASGNPRTVTAGSTLDFSGNGLTGALQGAIGGNIFLLLKSEFEDNGSRNLFRFASSRNTAGSPAFSGPVLTIDYTPIPEPTTALAGLLLGVGLLRRRRNQGRPVLSLACPS